MKGTSGVMLLPVLDLLTLLIIVLCGLAGFMGILRPEGVISIGALNSKREIVIGAQTKQEELKAIESKVKEQLESLQEDLETLRNAVPTNPTKDSALDQIKQLNDQLKRLSTLHQKIQTQLPSLQEEIAALSTKMASQQAKLSSLRDTMASEATVHMNKIQSLGDQTLLARKQESELQLRIQQLQQKRKELESRHQQLSQELQQIRSSIEKESPEGVAKRTLESTLSDIKSMSQKLRDIQNAERKLGEQIHRLQKELTIKRKAVETLERNLANKKVTYQAKLRELANLEKTVRNKESTIQVELQALEQKRKTLLAQRMSLNEDLKQLRKLLTNAPNHQALLDQIQQVQKEIEILETSLKANHSQGQELHEEILKLKKQLASKEKITSGVQGELSADLERLKAHSKRLEGESDVARQEHANLQTKLAALEKEREKQESILTQLRREWEQYKEIDSSETNLETVQRQIRAIMTQMTSTTAQLEAEREKVASLQKEIGDLEEKSNNENQEDFDIGTVESKLEHQKESLKKLEAQKKKKASSLDELRTVLANTEGTTYSVKSGAPKVKRGQKAEKNIFVVLSKGKVIPVQVPFYGGVRLKDGTIVIKPKRTGLEIEDSLKRDSVLLKDVLTDDFRKNGQVSILVNPDSFPEFRKLRDFLSKENIPTGWEPMDGTTIAFVKNDPNGEARNIPRQ